MISLERDCGAGTGGGRLDTVMKSPVVVHSSSISKTGRNNNSIPDVDMVGNHNSSNLNVSSNSSKVQEDDHVNMLTRPMETGPPSTNNLGGDNTNPSDESQNLLTNLSHLYSVSRPNRLGKHLTFPQLEQLFKQVSNAAPEVHLYWAEVLSFFTKNDPTNPAVDAALDSLRRFHE